MLMGCTRSGLLVAAATVAVAATGCGGGSGGGGGGTGSGPPPGPTYAVGVYQPPATYAAYCASPRAGTDPYNNNAPYPDRQGSAVWEKFWLRSWSNAYYLWYSQLPDIDPTLASNTTAAYFTLMKTTAVTASGTPVDRFHFTYPTSQWEALSQAGASVGYGVTWSLISTVPPREALVAYTEPASMDFPATSAAVHLTRGASILTVDGVDLVNSSDQASVNTLNAGLFPVNAGETHTFTVLDPGAATSRSITMTAVDITETPVQNVLTVATGTGTVGYLLFNDHIATAEGELDAAIATLAAAGVTDLVLDIRYNGGGYLDIASELAYMIAGPGPTTGQTFDLITFNDRYPTTDPITGAPIAPTPFHSVSQGFSTSLPSGAPLPTNTPLPSLNLPRVFVLTGTDTCSASEAIINSLNGVGVQVYLIGSQTCGKPYGFYPQDNCGTTYFSIEFKGVNAKGQGGYTDGFVAANTTSTTGLQLPGCSVVDDFAHALGDPSEARFAAALSYRTTGAAGCPTASGVGPGASPLSVDGHVVKPEWLKNRILGRPH